MPASLSPRRATRDGLSLGRSVIARFSDAELDTGVILDRKPRAHQVVVRELPLEPVPEHRPGVAAAAARRLLDRQRQDREPPPEVGGRPRPLAQSGVRALTPAVDDKRVTHAR